MSTPRPEEVASRCQICGRKCEQSLGPDATQILLLRPGVSVALLPPLRSVNVLHFGWLPQEPKNKRTTEDVACLLKRVNFQRRSVGEWEATKHDAAIMANFIITYSTFRYIV